MGIVGGLCWSECVLPFLQFLLVLVIIISAAKFGGYVERLAAVEMIVDAQMRKGVALRDSPGSLGSASVCTTTR